MIVPVVAISGSSGSGKTTLLVKVVAELVKRGWRVGTVKHDAHGFEIDRAGKDSWRHKLAGASTVALSSPERLAVIMDTPKEWPPERIISTLLTDVDVAVCEGFKTSSLPKIEVVRKANGKSPVCKRDSSLLAYATDMKIRGKIQSFGLDDARKIADFIEERIIKTHHAPGVSLIADGEVVELKPFIENLIRDGIVGMVRSLKGCFEAAEIEIRIKKK